MFWWEVARSAGLLLPVLGPPKLRKRPPLRLEIQAPHICPFEEGEEPPRHVELPAGLARPSMMTQRGVPAVIRPQRLTPERREKRKD
jgi:hypothetical protein